MAKIYVYQNRTNIGEIPVIKGEKGDPLTYEQLTTEQKADLRGIAIQVVTEQEYAALTTPESGVLYIVTSDSE